MRSRVNVMKTARDAERRPIFKKMIDKINEGGIDELIFSEFSRIGRTVDASLITLLKLKEKGIKITSLSPSESFINALLSELQTWMISGMMYVASLERKHIAERTRYGLNVARENGKKLGRPKIVVDMTKIEDTQKKYGVSENVARKIIGIPATTFYARKRELKQQIAQTGGI